MWIRICGLVVLDCCLGLLGSGFAECAPVIRSILYVLYSDSRSVAGVGGPKGGLSLFAMDDVDGDVDDDGGW